MSYDPFRVRAEQVWGAKGLRTNITLMESQGWEFVQLIDGNDPFTELSGFRCVIWRRPASFEEFIKWPDEHSQEGTQIAHVAEQDSVSDIRS